MLKMLIAVDGSDHSRRAVEAAARLAAQIPDAQAVLLLTAWSSDASARSRQRDIVRQRLGPAMASTVSRVSGPMESLKDALRLMVLDLCMPALQQLSQPQYMAFREALTEVIRADE